MQGLTSSMCDPTPSGWNGDNPLVIQGSIRDVIVHRVYVDTGSSGDILYEHCFRLLPNTWKERLRPTTGQLTGSTRHSLWPLVTIHLPFTLVSQDKTRRRTALIDFVVIRHPSEHNIILSRTALLRFGVVLSTIHRIIKFSTSHVPGTILATPLRELKCYECWTRV